MANINRCGCDNRRNNYGCLGCLGNRRCWDNFPIYNGPCPNADGEYDCDDMPEKNRDCGCRRRDQGAGFGMFSAMMPVAVAANGIIPLTRLNGACGGAFPVNSGLITIDERGTYLATYTVRVPEGADIASTITLNVDDASQSTAIAEIGGTAPVSSTAQAIFEVGDRATVALRSAEPINVTERSSQPLFTLTLVKLD